MRTLVFVLAGVLCSACASDPPAEGSALSDGSTAFTFKCDDGWSECYTAARKACGQAGFEEIDRAIDGSLSSSGRLQDRVFTDGGRENQVYDEVLRSEVTSRVITVRCKSR